MIKATVLKDSTDSGNVIYRGIVMEGHAGYAEEGEDIICAAVSALALNFFNSVEAFTEDEFEGGAGDVYKRQEGDLPCYKTGDGCVLIYGVFWWNMIYLSYSVFGILFILRGNQVISHGVPEYDRFIDGILQTEGLQVIICAFLLYHPNHVLPNSVA